MTRTKKAKAFAEARARARAAAAYAEKDLVELVAPSDLEELVETRPVDARAADDPKKKAGLAKIGKKKAPVAAMAALHECPACSKKFRTRKAMSDHCANKGDAAHEAYRTPAGLNFRVAAMTTSHGDAATTCPACSKKFPDKRAMKHHCANKGDAVHEAYRKREGLNLAVRPKGTGTSDDRPARPPTGRIPIGLLPARQGQTNFQRLPSGDSFSDNFSDSDSGGMYFDEGMYGFSAHDCDELLCQGVKPWDDDAGAVLGALHGW